MSEPCTAIQRGERRLSDTTQFKNTESYRSTLSYIQRHTSDYCVLTTCCLSSAIAALFQEISVKGVQVEGTQPTAQ